MSNAFHPNGACMHFYTRVVTMRKRRYQYSCWCVYYPLNELIFLLHFINFSLPLKINSCSGCLWHNFCTFCCTALEGRNASARKYCVKWEEFSSISLWLLRGDAQYWGNFSNNSFILLVKIFKLFFSRNWPHDLLVVLLALVVYTENWSYSDILDPFLVSLLSNSTKV